MNLLRSPVVAAIVAALIVALTAALLFGWAEMPRWRVVTWHGLSGICYTGSTDGRTAHLGYETPCK